MSPREQPQTEDQYCDWAAKTFGTDPRQLAKVYQLNVSAALTTIEDSEFWQSLPSRLSTISSKYRGELGADLFPALPSLKLDKKPYDSVINKCFRVNILWNRAWPSPPHDGWVTDQNFYSRIDDLIRTTAVCSYIDGPEAVITGIKSVCPLHCETRRLARDEGYYAQHLYIEFPVDTLHSTHGVEQHKLKVEIQVTTQAQYLLRQLTHSYYEEQRSKPRDPQDKWQWDYRTNKFKARYLSHALHLLEAMILDVRDQPEKK